MKANKITGETIRAGTWNVRGTNEEGSIKNLLNIMVTYNLQVLALQETKQKGSKVINVDGYKMFKDINIKQLEQKHVKDVNNAGSYNGTDSNTGHFLVIMDIKQLPQMTNKNKYGKRKKYNIRRFKESNAQQKVETKISSDSEQMNEYESVEEEWAQIKND
ncbi:hypothetical protein ILUMI_14577 [Ignelater luminosus]|uniref:Craniofacial development protein 2-like n=1 Tax=Ignelater luminosus TaxID=2038154 RepID=A0A8K0CUN5_IGNLU|nr:hypothetical protein ILUMI_14577 [Ignelater luminosus]